MMWNMWDTFVGRLCFLQLASEIPFNLISNSNLDLKKITEKHLHERFEFHSGKGNGNKCILNFYYVLDHYKQNRPRKRSQDRPFACECLSQNFMTH